MSRIVCHHYIAQSLCVCVCVCVCEYILLIVPERVNGSLQGHCIVSSGLASQVVMAVGPSSGWAVYCHRMQDAGELSLFRNAWRSQRDDTTAAYDRKSATLSSQNNAALHQTAQCCHSQLLLLLAVSAAHERDSAAHKSRWDRLGNYK